MVTLPQKSAAKIHLKCKQLNTPFCSLVVLRLCHFLLLRSLAVLVTTNELVPHKIQS